MGNVPRAGIWKLDMRRTVTVHMLPQFAAAEQLNQGIAVVIDILRASTTVVHALAHGAAAVIPCETVEEALSLKASHSPQKGSSGDEDENVPLLGGERHGVRIDGFDLGNSPFEYTADVVAERTIIFTTTNGTRALRHCEAAARVLMGAFVNRAALVRVLSEDHRPVHLICAGTDGQLTAEDILFAGTVAAELTGAIRPGAAGEISSLDVQTQMAIDYALARSADEAAFRETIRSSRGGQNLQRLGMDADIDRAAQCDLFDLVPEWDPTENRIIRSVQT